MNLIFAHDHRFKEDINGNLYSGNDFNKDIWNRYKDIGENITIIARCEKIKNENELKGYSLLNEKNVNLIKLNNLNNPKILLSEYNISKKKIKDAVKKSDTLICRLPSTIGILVCNEAEKQAKPYFIEMVGCSWDSFWNYGTVTGKFMAPVYYLMNKKRVKISKHVIYVTNEFLQKRYPNTNHNLGCSDVSIKVIEKILLNKRLERMKQKNFPINVGLIGSLDVNYKGHKTAIKAINLLKKKGININLRFLGNGDNKRWKKIAENMGINKNIKFDGLRKSGQPVLEWLDEIDIYIQPSTTEAMPRAVIEAQSRGCPVVVTNCGEMKWLVDENFVIKKNDFKNLAKKIELLITNFDIFKNQVEKNIKYSQNYEKKILNKRRGIFYDEFKKNLPAE